MFSPERQRNLMDPFNYLINHDLYKYYDPIALNQPMTIDTASITKENYEEHYRGLLAVLEDGIEQSEVQKYKLTVNFADGVSLHLNIFDYYLSLIMWYILIRTNTPIESKHIFFDKDYTQDSIKQYIDDFFIDPFRRVYGSKEMNNIIDDTLFRIHDIDKFAFFLGNTVNLEDTAFLMQLDPEFNECTHLDLSGVPIEEANEIGNKYSAKSIERIKQSKALLGYPHCLTDALRAKQGINIKQYKEFSIGVGAKPDGRGGIYPDIINHSFINGGVATPKEYFIDSATGRNAQIIKFNNVGNSGFFARLLGLNNMDSFLHDDPNYDCGSRHLIEVTPKDLKSLKMLNNRYYRLHPMGVEKLLRWKECTHLVGQTLYIRSPITCASAARGKGICYKCYGELAYTMKDPQTHFGINIGRIASETVSSKLTQKLLSAKHLLEAAIRKLKWSAAFSKFFEVEFNVIKMLDDIDNLKDYRMVIDRDSIELENEEDDDLFNDEDEGPALFNEYITDFYIIQNSTGEKMHVTTMDSNKLYLTTEINTIIRKKAVPMENTVVISFNELKEIPLFVVAIDNDELSKTLKHLEDLLNNNSTMKGKTLVELVQSLLDTNVKGGLSIASVHMEVILSNQIRSAEDILERPDWTEVDPHYQILSLNGALTNNPSPTISISYQKIGKMLYNPLTYRKHGASFMDLFFMERPQYVINGLPAPSREEVALHRKNDGELIDPMMFYEDPHGATTSSAEEIDDSPN